MTLPAIGSIVLAMGGWISHNAAPKDVLTAALTVSTGPIPPGAYMLVQAFANDACEKHPVERGLRGQSARMIRST